MKITVSGKHGSINDLVWDDVPDFAVITGRNGAGKSQLLEVIANTYGALREIQPNSHPMKRSHGISPAKVTIDGASFTHGEVFHSYSTWQLLREGPANAGEVKQALRELFGGPAPPVGDPSWIAEKIAKRAAISVEEVKKLTPAQIEPYVTPSILWGRTLPAAPRSLAFLFLAYRMLEHNALRNGKSMAEVYTLFGEAPWSILNSILTAASLPFRVVEPEPVHAFSILEPESYTLKLRDIERDCEVPLDMLSSGERVIMSTALWRFGVEEVGRHYKLLLLDEPDAHLHPSMTRRLLDVIQRVFVEERGVRVVMTTHSPSTVALVPEASLFEMRRHEAPRLRRAPNKSSLIADLTDGFLVVHEGMSVVFCEGDNDSPFYKVVWERLTEPVNSNGDSTLARTPPLVFMHGKGIATIRGIVPQLRAAGLFHFHGLIDLDNGNKAEGGIHVIGRRAIENYLFDPINIWFHLHNEDKAPNVEGVAIPRGQRARVRDLNDDLLQRIADKVLALVESHLAGLLPADKSMESVQFVGGNNVRYPKWLLRRDKDALRAAYCKALPGLRGKDYVALTTSFASLDMIPIELLELMRSIQGYR